ncbi:MAG: TolB family protein, partial [Panacagrimonas sp.]
MLTVIGAAQAAPFTAQDLVMMKRVSDPRLSPDGAHVAYTLRTTDLDGNKGVKQVWMVDRASGRSRQVTSGSGNSHTPRWSGDGQLYFLSNRSGSNQVWRLDPTGGEAQAVTSLPLEIGAFAVAPTSDRIALALDVFPECAADLDCSARKLKEQDPAKVGGRRYDRLFVRHWDSWKNGTRSQLFLVAFGAPKAEPKRLTSGGDGAPFDGDVPTKPFGGDEEFEFSPDGRTLFFTARIAGKTEA